MPERTKKLIPLQTIVGAININVKGQLTTFNVLYSGAMVPWINGEMLFLQGKRYNDMLRDFFENEGREYIIPTVTEINQIQAAVINDYKAGKFIDPNANVQNQEEQAEEENDTSNIADTSNTEEEIEDEASKEDEYEDEEYEQFEDDTVDDNIDSENSAEDQEGIDSEQEEIENENNNVEYIENDAENMFGSKEATTESYSEEDCDSEIVNSEIVNKDNAQELEKTPATGFEISNASQRNDYYREEQNEASNYKYDAANNTPDYEEEMDIVRYKHAPKNINYNFSDISLDELKEIIDDQNKIMMQQNEMILNLSTSVTEQQKSIDEFKKKINNSNVFCKTNLHKTIIAMIICLLITIGTIVGMQLYAPKMESAIALDPNTDAEVHIVIHNDDGTDTFERIGTIRIVDGKLVTSDANN